MWRRVAGYAFFDVSNRRFALMFRVLEEFYTSTPWEEGATSFAESGIVQSVTRRHISQERNPRLHRCSNLKNRLIVTQLTRILFENAKMVIIVSAYIYDYLIFRTLLIATVLKIT